MSTELKHVEAGAVAAPTNLQMTSPLFDPAQFHQAMEVAKVMATATVTIPEEYRGKPGNCLAVIEQAMRWRFSPFALANKTHFVSGKIGFESQAICAAINNSGELKEDLNYRWEGDWDKILGKFVERESKTKKDDHGNPQKYKVPAWKAEDEEGLKVLVWATKRGESSPRILELKLTQARTRNSTLWAEDPRQQLAYLAGKRWGRLHTPGVIMGVYSPDELAEPQERFMGNAEVEPPPSKTPAALPDYPSDQFDKNLPKWQAAITKGTTTADRVIGTVGTKYVLSEAQIAAIRAPVKPAETAAPADQTATATSKPAVTTNAPPEITAEIIEKRLRNAEDQELLAIAADLIGEIQDAGQRTHLVEIYHECQQKLIQE